MSAVDDPPSVSDSPFVSFNGEHINTQPVVDANDPIVHEPASDGLALSGFTQRSVLTWFRGYTRAGCRCGQCPLRQVEPCDYALPERPSLIAQTCSAMYSGAGTMLQMTHSGLAKIRPAISVPVQRSDTSSKQS